jgi:hypothetical protein
VEGPRDREVLRGWAARLLPLFTREVLDAAVILGGRQPERARSHFREHRAREPRVRGLCVLDGDGGDHVGVRVAEPDLEVFTWSRRHIESYLLVPEAIRRSLRAERRDGHRVDRLLREHLPAAGDEATLRAIDAKRLLAPDGPLAHAVGQPLRAGRIARAMRPSEIHADVHALYARLRGLLGLAPPENLHAAARDPE